MKSSSTSLIMLLLIASSLLLSGCASKQPERRFTMPSWVDGYDPDEERSESDSENYAAESSADASDRIQQEADAEAVDGIDAIEGTEAVEGTDATEQAAPDTASAQQADSEEAPASEQTEQQAAETPEPEVKLPPKPKPLTARNEQQALDAQQAGPRFKTALEKMKAGDLEAALLLFQELSAQFPSLTGPVVNQAIVLRLQEKYEQAKSVLQGALLNKAQNPYLMNELGLVHRQLGNFEAAKQAYLAAIRLEPNYDKAHYNLGVLADLYLHDPALAFEHFQIYQTLQVEPNKKVAGWLKEIERRIP